MGSPVSSIQEEIAAYLQEDENILASGAQVLCENTLEVDAKVCEELAKLGICAVVSTPSLTLLGEGAQDAPPVFQASNLSIVCVETHAINRLRPNAATALDVAVAIAKRIYGWHGISINSIEQAFEPEDGRIIVTVLCSSAIIIKP